MHVIADEVHALTQDSSYRPETGHFLELLYNHWKGSITLTTATEALIPI